LYRSSLLDLESRSLPGVREDPRSVVLAVPVVHRSVHVKARVGLGEGGVPRPGFLDADHVCFLVIGQTEGGVVAHTSACVDPVDGKVPGGLVSWHASAPAPLWVF